MKVILTTLNAKYIHKNLALRWLYVASPMKESTKILEYTIKDDVNRISDALCEENADVICFSCYIWNIEPTRKIISLIKEKQPSVKILVGGPEVSFESEALLHEGVDAISIGEGEQSVWEYITSLNNRHEITGIHTLDYPNTTYAYSDIAFNESLELPYFLDFDQNDMDKRYFYFETSRGCPYGCEYCLSSTDKKVRMFSEEYIFKVLEKISTSSVKQVKFLDRTFNVKPERALKIARYINENCVNQIFQFEIVAETLSEELLDFFTNEADKSRFRFEVGVQSFNSNTLKAVGRIQNNERLKYVIERLRKANVVMHVDLIAGLPYEGLDSFRNSFNELFACQASELQLGILKLLKGTSLKQKSPLYDFVYDSNPPYEILKTRWLDEEALKDINLCAMAVEKFWNSGKCRNAIQTILDLKMKTSAFDFFMELGRGLARYNRVYHVHDMFLVLKETLKDEDEILIDAILMTDYMALFKQKPKRFTMNKVTHEMRKQAFELLSEQNIVGQNELYHYALVELAYDKAIGMQVVLYNKEQKLPKRWLIIGNESRELK